MENSNEIATALIEAQKEMTCAKKDAVNPFFKSKYADLSSIIQAIKDPLLKNDICYVQTVESLDGNNFLRTTLIHKSGQSISGSMLIKPTKDDMQGLGSAVTYARRYGLQAIVGLPAEDDDGNAASAPKEYKKTEPMVIPTREVDEEIFKGKPQDADTCTCGAVISEKVKKFSMDKYGKACCFDCQKLEK